MNFKTYIEKKRGFGFKQPGKYYLVGLTWPHQCSRLPIALLPCHCCGISLQFSESITWVTSKLFTGSICNDLLCEIHKPAEKLPVLWVSDKHYPTTTDFQREVLSIGISLPADPGMQLLPGAIVLLAHNKAVPVINADPAADLNADLVTYQPGIFCFMKVSRYQFFIKPGTAEKKLQDLQRRKIELITVEREGTPLNLFV